MISDPLYVSFRHLMFRETEAFQTALSITSTQRHKEGINTRVVSATRHANNTPRAGVFDTPTIRRCLWYADTNDTIDAILVSFYLTAVVHVKQINIWTGKG